jgi:hypothetical protein
LDIAGKSGKIREWKDKLGLFCEFPFSLLGRKADSGYNKSVEAEAEEQAKSAKIYKNLVEFVSGPAYNATF